MYIVKYRPFPCLSVPEHQNQIILRILAMNVLREVVSAAKV